MAFRSGGLPPLATPLADPSASSGQAAHGKAHTNTIESAWSLLNRSIVGACHQVGKKHLDAYLNEFEWRFNNRQNPYLFRDTMLKLINAPKMEYRELVEKSA